MKALSVKNDSWIYVSGLKPQQELIENDANSKEQYDKWTNLDE